MIDRNSMSYRARNAVAVADSRLDQICSEGCAWMSGQDQRWINNLFKTINRCNTSELRQFDDSELSAVRNLAVIGILELTKRDVIKNVETKE